MELSPNHERASGNKLFYEKELQQEAEQKSDKMLRGDDGSPGLDVNTANGETVDGAHTSYERQMYIIYIYTHTNNLLIYSVVSVYF